MHKRGPPRSFFSQLSCWAFAVFIEKLKKNEKTPRLNDSQIQIFFIDSQPQIPRACCRWKARRGSARRGFLSSQSSPRTIGRTKSSLKLPGKFLLLLKKQLIIWIPITCCYKFKLEICPSVSNPKTTSVSQLTWKSPHWAPENHRMSPWGCSSRGGTSQDFLQKIHVRKKQKEMRF